MSLPKSHKIRENKEIRDDEFFEELEKLDTAVKVKELNLFDPTPFQVKEVITPEVKPEPKEEKKDKYKEEENAKRPQIFFESNYSTEEGEGSKDERYAPDVNNYLQIDKSYREENERVFKSKYEEVLEQMSEQKKK